MKRLLSAVLTGTLLACVSAPAFASTNARTVTATTSTRNTTPIRTLRTGKGVSNKDSLTPLPSSALGYTEASRIDPNLVRKRAAENTKEIFPVFNPPAAKPSTPKTAPSKAPAKTPKALLGLRSAKGKTPTKAQKLAAAKAALAEEIRVRSLLKELSQAKKPLTQKGLIQAVLQDRTREEISWDSTNPRTLGESVSPSDLAPGDVLIFAFSQGSRRSFHAGVYAGGNRFAYGSQQGVQLRDLNAQWRNQLEEVRRVSRPAQP